MMRVGLGSLPEFACLCPPALLGAAGTEGWVPPAGYLQPPVQAAPSIPPHVSPATC